MTCAALYSVTAGIGIDANELMKAGRRAWKKAANFGKGFTRKDDAFPERWISEPVKRDAEEIYLECSRPCSAALAYHQDRLALPPDSW